MTRRSTPLLACALLSTPAFALTPSASSPAGTLQRELPAADAGALREVVEPSGCTGTIIAPYAVLTANHCDAPALIRVQSAHEPSGWANYNVTGWLYTPWLQRSRHSASTRLAITVSSHPTRAGARSSSLVLPPRRPRVAA